MKKTRKEKQAEAQAEERPVLICVLISEQPVSAVKAWSGLCERCHRPVWVSHSSPLTIQGKECERCCGECVAATIRADTLAGEKIKFHPLSSRQVQDILGCLSKSRFSAS